MCPGLQCYRRSSCQELEWLLRERLPAVIYYLIDWRPHLRYRAPAQKHKRFQQKETSSTAVGGSVWDWFLCLHGHQSELPAWPLRFQWPHDAYPCPVYLCSSLPWSLFLWPPNADTMLCSPDPNRTRAPPICRSRWSWNVGWSCLPVTMDQLCIPAGQQLLCHAVGSSCIFLNNKNPFWVCSPQGIFSQTLAAF